MDIQNSSYKVIGTVNPGNTVRLLCRTCHQKVHDLCKEKPKLNLYKAFVFLKKDRVKQGLVTLTIEVVNEYNNKRN